MSKFILILIVSMTSNGASVEVDHVEFFSESACEKALAEIVREYERDPADAGNEDARRLSRLHVDGWCVDKGSIY